MATEGHVAVLILALPNSTPAWQDAFGVFAHAARRAFETSKFKMSLIAAVPEGMPLDDRKALERWGFQVREAGLPVRRNEVRNSFARDEFSKGCMPGDHGVCQETEALKLVAAKLVEFDHVVVCDGDTLLLQNIDELFGLTQHSLLATYDHELDFHSFDNTKTAIPVVNGGWFVIKPNASDYDNMVALLKEGDFRSGTGWHGTRVGWGYGGIGVQGILAYYYNMDALSKNEIQQKKPDIAEHMTIGPKDSRILTLDRSVYDVIDTPDLQEALRSGEASEERMKVFHFTGNCLKPWQCYTPRSSMCESMHRRWWAFRAEMAEKHGIQATNQCSSDGQYVALDMHPSF